jgi:hypothetical protein
MLLATAVAVLSVLAVAAPAGGYVAWVAPGTISRASFDGTDVRARAAAGAKSGLLADVSCTSARACVAVGGVVVMGSAPGGYTLAERWNGRAWRILRSRNPRGADLSVLHSVSCASARDCVAVGEYETVAHPHGSIPLAEVWNGRTWTIKPAPAASYDAGLIKVSCSGPNACVATGYALGRGQNNWFADVWNGRSWTLSSAPRPAGTTYSSIPGLSCVSVSVCVGVGDYQVNGSSDGLTLAESWGGTRWTIDLTPNPTTGANGSQLSGVSCGSMNICMAVGTYAKPSNQGSLPLAEMWDGTAWAMTTPVNAGPATSVLEGVSCGVGNACTAVGDSITSSGRARTLVERWNGTAWTIQPSPTPPRATQTFLGNVSCGSSRACVAVGDYFANPFAPSVPLSLIWNGKTWNLKPAPL